MHPTMYARVPHLSLVVSLLAGSLCSLPAAAQVQMAEPHSSALRPGDVLRIAVWETPKLSGDFEVALNGTLKHPLYNQLTVTGIPLRLLRERVDSFVRQFQNSPRIEIEPLMRVAVGGEVRSPGSYTVTAGTSVTDLVVRAGGMTERARSDRVRVLRASKKLTVKLSSATAPGSSDTLISGDQVTVLRRRDIFREYIAPGASVAAGLTSLLVLFLR
jgi:polysaccharide export outer membrane protein